MPSSSRSRTSATVRSGAFLEHPRASVAGNTGATALLPRMSAGRVVPATNGRSHIVRTIARCVEMSNARADALSQNLTPNRRAGLAVAASRRPLRNAHITVEAANLLVCCAGGDNALESPWELKARSEAQRSPDGCAR